MAGRKTEHFAAEQWVDFVHGQLPEEQKQGMQDHLNAGCAVCLKSSKLWGQIDATAKHESLHEAPEWAFRHVRNAFAVFATPHRTKRGLRVPRLVFDSLLQPAAVGVRSAPNAPRHLLFKSEQIAITMQLEPEFNSERIDIAGQVSNAALQGEGLAGIPIRITDALGKVVEASSNKLGEFRISFIPEKGLLFSLELLNGEHLCIPLFGTEEGNP
jgi:hypothetical protein